MPVGLESDDNALDLTKAVRADVLLVIKELVPDFDEIVLVDNADALRTEAEHLPNDLESALLFLLNIALHPLIYLGLQACGVLLAKFADQPDVSIFF